MKKLINLASKIILFKIIRDNSILSFVKVMYYSIIRAETLAGVLHFLNKAELNSKV